MVCWDFRAYLLLLNIMMGQLVWIWVVMACEGSHFIIGILYHYQEEMFNHVGKAKVFNKVDLRFGYWRMLAKLENVPKIDFKTC